MKGDMEVEVLKDTSEADGLAFARKRKERCVMSADEQALYRYSPGAARGNRNPGFPDEDYGTGEA